MTIQQLIAEVSALQLAVEGRIEDDADMEITKCCLKVALAHLGVVQAELNRAVEEESNRWDNAD